MATNKLAHKGFTGSVEVSLDDGCLVGRVLFISDIITYEGETVAALTANFESAVDRYLVHCERTGKPANRPYSGTFNVRVGPELHREAAIAADQASINLNEFVLNAIKAAVEGAPAIEVVHQHNHIISIQRDSVQQPVWSAMATSPNIRAGSLGPGATSPMAVDASVVNPLRARPVKKKMRNKAVV